MGRRHISTSGFGATATETAFFALFFEYTAQQSVLDGPNGLSSSNPCAYGRILRSELKLGVVLALELCSVKAYAWISDINLLPILWNTCVPVYNSQHAQVTVHTGDTITQVSNCQGSCQTNSRRYDDLLSTVRDLRLGAACVTRD